VVKHHSLFAILLACCVASATAAEPAPDLRANTNIPLWTGTAPGANGDGPLDAPFLTVFTPRAGTANGSAVVIAPGGGNIMLMYGGEGAEVAEVYNDWGVTAFVLTYRLSPRYDNDARTRDGERAMRLVRANAAKWNLDPARIGLIGFSAGGSLARAVMAASDGGDAAATDPVERASSRPDYLGLVYGAGRATPEESLKDYPPTFLLSAAGDQGPSLANAQLFTELTKAGAVAELHIYQRGRHGFGSGVGSSEFGDWMPRLQGFLRVAGFLPSASATTGAPGIAMKAVAAPVNDGYGDYVFVPKGPFKMGDELKVGLARERPAHIVELDAFYISKFEITNREWKRFRDDPGYDDVKYWPNGRIVPRDQIPYWTQANNHGGGTPESDDYPVIGVNWDAATAYCAWLSAKTGKRYRLPTEAEWEKAARGQVIDRQHANYVGAQAYDTVMPVGSFKDGASMYGAFDMAGNVLEWTQDWYDRDYYSVSPRKNPRGPASGAYKVVRGGSFFVEPFDLRASARFMAWPSFQAYRMIGFRPVREP